MYVQFKTVPEHQVAFIYHKGGFEKIPEYLGEVVEWLITSELEIREPIYAVFYNSPLEVPDEELEWEVGASFVGDVEGEDKIQLQVIPEQEVIYTIFKGPYVEASAAYFYLYEYAMDNDLQITGPVKEIYLNSPDAVSESELETEVQLPVMKNRII
jgi:AraC family transcriptional regulator